mgnify:CR=1 FL=1
MTPTTFPQMLPSATGNRPPLSEEELQRLAALLQQRGEGLAAINPSEASLLKALGGSGEPIAGTQGLGVGRGPIKSYSWLSSQLDSLTSGMDDTVQSAIDKANAEAARLAAEQKRKNDQRQKLKTSFETLEADTTWEDWEKLGLMKDMPDLPHKEFVTAYDAAVAKKIAEESSRITGWINKKFSTGAFTSLGQRTTDETGGVVDVVPTTFEEADAILLAESPRVYGRLKEAQRRSIFNEAQKLKTRQERFTLSEEDIAKYQTEAPTLAPVADVGETQIADELEGVTIGEVDPLERTDIDLTPDYDPEFLDQTRAGEADLVQLLKDRVAGEAPSPAEIQHNQQTEQNLRMLLGASSNAQADPGRLRQVQNLWRDVQQIATGQAAVLRSQEQIDAEGRLLQLYQQQGTREASLALAKLSVEKEKAFAQGNLDQASNIAQMEANITRVTAQASSDLVKLEASKQILIQNGQMSMATKLANLEKSLLISQTNAEAALKSRSLDNALAMAAFQGEMALEGVAVNLELAAMDVRLRTELGKLGIDSQEKLAALSRAQQMSLAEMNAQIAKEAQDSAKSNAIMSGIATIVAAWLMMPSDRRVKKKIKPAKTKVQDFLDSLKAYSYEYKKPDSPGARHGEMLGVMAQDLEKTTLGKQFVRDTPAGKFVDMGQGLAAILASQAYLNDRVKTLAKRV